MWPSGHSPTEEAICVIKVIPFPHRVFPRTLDATEWLAQRLSGEPGSATPVEISRAMDEIRADVSPRVRLRDVG